MLYSTRQDTIELVLKFFDINFPVKSVYALQLTTGILNLSHINLAFGARCVSRTVSIGAATGASGGRLPIEYREDRSCERSSERDTIREIPRNPLR